MLPKPSPATQAAWEAGMIAAREAQREAAHQKAIEDQLRLLPRRLALADYFTRHPERSLLDYTAFLRETADNDAA